MANKDMEKEDEQLEWPQYKPNGKDVRALKISTVVYSADGEALMTPMDTAYEPFVVDVHFAQRWKPSNGGYFVVFDTDEPTKCDTFWHEEAFNQVFGEAIANKHAETEPGHRNERVRFDNEQHGRDKLEEKRPDGSRTHSNTSDTHANQKKTTDNTEADEASKMPVRRREHLHPHGKPKSPNTTNTPANFQKRE